MFDWKCVSILKMRQARPGIEQTIENRGVVTNMWPFWFKHPCVYHKVVHHGLMTRAEAFGSIVSLGRSLSACFVCVASFSGVGVASDILRLQRSMLFQRIATWRLLDKHLARAVLLVEC